jgi:hypothetical protein
MSAMHAVVAASLGLENRMESDKLIWIVVFSLAWGVGPLLACWADSSRQAVWHGTPPPPFRASALGSRPAAEALE